MKKILLLIIMLVFPLRIYAYSNYVYRGGNTLGIEINSNGILIVGFYEINNHKNLGNIPLNVGDYILKINDTNVNSLKELTEEIEKYTKDGYVTITFRRGKSINNTKLDLIKEDGIYKTGLYVKDNIIGIGTLTYIDPNTSIYGALGHEIMESNSQKIVEIKSGNIFKNKITSITKSKVGYAGSKNASYYYDTIYGNIKNNTNHGIFGTYTNSLDNYELIEVSKEEDIKIGEASIYTVLKGEDIKEYKIYIKSINNNSDTKNIIFQITDKDLIEKSGGVIQGMSGSPIVQNNKLIGVVTHVIVDNPLTGYGLFITKMLEEGDKLA